MPRKKKPAKSQTDSAYDEPDLPEEARSAGDDIIDPPEDDETAIEDYEDDPVDSEAGGPMSHVDSNLLEAKAAIEAALVQRTGTSASAMEALDDDGPELIQGVGIGAPEIDVDQIGPDGPGSLVLNVYTAEKQGQEEVRRTLYDGYSVQSVADDAMPLNIYDSGIIDTQPHRFKQRPSANGISVGQFQITAGTQGALCTGLSAPRNRRVLMLSNNHVLANSNRANIGDNILQPGPADGGQNPGDRIGILEDFVRIDFSGGNNFVDCATAWCWSSRVRREFLFLAGGQVRFFRVGSQPIAARRGMIVGKTGRTTQLRSGRVTGTSETIRVNFQGRMALFRDQIAIRGTRGDFSRGGDSGSLIWTWDSARRPVGLLFAGGNGVTFGNKIGRVLQALKIRLTT